MAISRQRRWQLKKAAEGKCSICGKGEVYRGERCEEHYTAHVLHMREHMRQKLGCKRYTKP